LSSRAEGKQKGKAGGGRRKAEVRKFRSIKFWQFIIAGNFHGHEIHHEKPIMKILDS
jgi:hypothetical protein